VCVGHTHCILDQRFAPIARLRSETSLLSLFAIFRDIPLAWDDTEKQPHMIWIEDGVLDWESLLTRKQRGNEPFWSGIKNIRDVRQLRFKKGCVYMDEFEVGKCMVVVCACTS
jgi:hypothetical protein